MFDLTEALLSKKLEEERKSNLVEEGLDLVAVSRHKPFVIACIPAFREEEHIAKVILEARRFVDEVIVCDDGSDDSTSNIAEALGAFVLKHERNLGYGASIISLFKEASRLSADYVVTLDSDGQHDPKEIPLLIERIRKGDVDLVIGSRFIKGGGSEAPGWRKFGIKTINGISQNGYHLTDTQSGFRAYTRRAIQNLALTEDGMGLSTEILIKSHEAGLKIAEVPIHVTYGAETSSQNPLTHGIDVMLSSFKHMSIHHPLLSYGLPGMIAMAISLVFWVMALEEFGRTRALLTNLVLLGIGSMSIGMMFLITAIILWVMTTLIREQIKA